MPAARHMVTQPSTRFDALATRAGPPPAGSRGPRPRYGENQARASRNGTTKRSTKTDQKLSG